MARSSTSFKPGNKSGGRPPGLPNKITADQRQIFDLAIPPEQRVEMVKTAFARAMLGDKDSANYMKLLFDFVFSRPKIGHQVELLDMNEILSTEVCAGVWKEIQAEARERERSGSQANDQARLGIIDAQVVETAKGNGRRNGPARNSRKKKAANKKARKG